jgi:alanine racemase
LIPDRPTRAEISISALQHNFAIARQLAGKAKLMAVVKAEAYGHGLQRIAREFDDLGADYLGVSFLEEGVQLREAGFDIPILVMGALVDEQIERYLDNNLEITISSVWKAQRVDEVAASHRTRATVQLKIDTGMGRIGQQWHTAKTFLDEVARLSHLNINGICTHLAESDSADPTYTQLQLDRFNSILELARKIGLEPPLIHAANSGALIQHTEAARFTMVRPGLMLYGYPPRADLEATSPLKPAMTLRTSVVYVKKPPAGTSVGYGGTWTSPGDRWIATLPIGYGDGYPRRAGNRAWVMLRGRRCPVVGNVSMDQITVDAGHEAWLKDEAILFGGSGSNRLDLWELAKTLETIPYELTTCLTLRVPRVYIE